MKSNMHNALVAHILVDFIIVIALFYYYFAFIICYVRQGWTN